jgi:2-methylcitrate dehydratase PrpD
MRNPLQAYGSWLAEAPRDWPLAASHAAHRQFVDIAGVALRGAIEEPSRLVFATVSKWGTGPCSVVGTGMSLAAPWAALVNGTAAHALDFDDNFDPGKAHATAVLAPAILALAEQEGASGADCIDAYIAGLQILGRVGQGVNPVHRTRGWHATGTVGAIGAAAAAARILRLPAEQAAHALSIATSMAGGFMSQFGTMTKPLHAGLAAQAGVMAAKLARNGVDAGADTLDGPTGMSRLMVGPDYDALRDQLGESDEPVLRFETEQVGEPLLIFSHGLRVKRFPNCGSAHRSMDAMLELLARRPFGPAEVAQVTVSAPRFHLGNLMYDDPRSDLQARFSLEFALALLIDKGECRLSDFTEQTVMRDDIRALYPRIRKVPRDGPASDIAHHVEVALIGGERLAASVTHAVGSRAAPFSWDQQWAKLDACLEDLLAPEALTELKGLLQRLPDLNTVAPLMRSLRQQIRPMPPSA